MDPHAGECMDALIEADECISMFDKQDEQEMRDHRNKVVGQAGFTMHIVIGVGTIWGHMWVLFSFWVGAATPTAHMIATFCLRPPGAALMWLVSHCISQQLFQIIESCLGPPASALNVSMWLAMPLGRLSSTAPSCLNGGLSA